MVYSVVVAHVYAQNHGSRFIRNAVSIRRILLSGENNYSPMHIIQRSSHNDRQWSQNFRHHWFLQMLLSRICWRFYHLVCIPRWKYQLLEPLQIPAWFLEDWWRCYKEHEGNDFPKNLANQFHIWQRNSQLWILQPFSSSQIIGIWSSATPPLLCRQSSV